MQDCVAEFHGQVWKGHTWLHVSLARIHTVTKQQGSLGPVVHLMCPGRNKIPWVDHPPVSATSI